MAPVQLLARAPAPGHRGLEIVEPDPTLPVQAYGKFEASAPGRPLRLGTELLLRVAVEMRDLGYKTTHIQIVGSDFRSPDESPEFEEISTRALALVQYDSIDDVLSFFRNVAQGYFVTAIEVRSLSGEGRVTVRRTGWLTVHNSKSVGAVKITLQETSRRVGIV